MKRELIPYNVMAHRNWERAPRDPVTVGGAILSGLGAGGLAGASAIFGLTTVGAIVGYVAVTAVTSWALQALAPKPDFGRFGTSSAGLLVNDRNAVAPQDFIYGEVRKGGTVVYDETTGEKNKFLHRVIALAGHEVEEIGDIYINDEPIEFGGFNYEVEVTYERSGGGDNAPPPSTLTTTSTYTGVSAADATYQVDDSLSASDLVDLEANSVGSSRNWANTFSDVRKKFVSAKVLSREESSSGMVVSAPYAGKIRINRHLGDQTAPDADLLAESELVDDEGNKIIDENFVGNDIAYIYVRFEYDREVFANGLPLITAKIKGKKVFDPRTSTTAYSNNAALCLRDYLTASYGLQDSDIDEAAFQIAANECDEAVALAGGGTEPKYTMNGVVRSDQNFGDVLQQMTTCCTGTLFWGMGAWDLVAGAYSAPVLDFTLDDLRGPISVDPLTNLRDSFNAVSGTFNDAEQDYITVDYPTVTSSAFEAQDGGQRLPLDLELPFTTSAATAQRIAKLTLFRAREQISMSADFSLKAFNVEVGDIITFTNERYGWNQKQFEVVGWNLNIGEGAGITVRLSLQETSAAAYDWNAEESDIIGNDSNLPSPFSGLEINNLVASGGGRTQSDGTFVNTAILSWDDADSSFVNEYEVQWRPLSDSSFSTTVTSESTIEIAPLIDNVEYIFRVRAITDLGNRGPFTSVTFTGGGDETAPSLPTNISATGGFKYITIDWTNPPESDVNYIEIWENDTDSPFGGALVGEVWGNQFVRTNLGLNVTKFYFLRAVDYSGNTSDYTEGVSATTTFLDDPDFENGIRTLFEEQGLYPIEDVDGLPPSGILGRKVFNRQDGKLYEWNGSAWVLVIADVANNSITETKISDGAISTPKLQSNSIVSDKIAGNTITGNKIAANTITGGLIATSGVITNSAQINNGLITSAKIQNLAVDTIKVANDSITRQDFIDFSQQSGSGPYIFESFFNMTFPGSVIVISNLEVFGTASDTSSVTYRLKIDGSTKTSINFTGGILLGLKTLSGGHDLSSGLFSVRVEVDNINFSNPAADCQITVLRRFK